MRKFILLLFLPLPFCSNSQSLSKTLGYINNGRYEFAYASVQEFMKKQPDNPAAQFLLAKSYSMQDNPQYNLDSANKFILKSAEGLHKKFSEKDSLKMAEVGWRPYTVYALEKQINAEAYRTVSESNIIGDWNHFINTYTSYASMNEVIEKRNTLAFNIALSKNDCSTFEEFTAKYPEAAQAKEARHQFDEHLYKIVAADGSWQAYKTFIDRNPKSPYYKEAKSKYESQLYAEKTKPRTVDSYVNFTQQYPASPFVNEAEDSVFAMVTRDDQVSSYIDFINRFSYNHNYLKAWQRVYEKETPVYSNKTFTRFAQKYPLYPNMTQLQKDIKQSLKQYESYKENGLYGYVDVKTKTIAIRAQFAEAAPFYEGMAVVKLPCQGKKCTYAYVNMSGQLITTYPWSVATDFFEGHAMAAIGECPGDSCKYGFLNRFGQWIVKPQFDVAYEFSEGLAVVHDIKKGYGYIDKQGKVQIPLRYSEAGTFSEGFGAVQEKPDGLFGFVDRNGNYIIPPSFKKAGAFRESLAPVADVNGLWGYIDHNGRWVIPPQYEFALPFIAGTARVVVEERDKKDVNVVTMRDKVIDKKGRVLRQ